MFIVGPLTSPLLLTARAHGINPKATDRSPDESIALDGKVHGSGLRSALGRHVGQDARHRLNAKRPEVDVTVTDGKSARCAHNND